MASDDIQKLPPAERIKRLKELEAKKKKEIEEAQKQIQDSEGELNEQRKWQDKVPIPEVAKEDLEGLSETAREILKVQRGVKEREESKEEVPVNKKSDSRSQKSSLEETVAKEPVRSGKIAASVEYGINPAQGVPPQVFDSAYTTALSQKPFNDLYQGVQAVTRQAEEKGYFNLQEQRQVAYWTSAMEQKLQDVEAGRYSMSSEEVARAASMVEESRNKVALSYKSDKAERKGHDWYKSG